MKQIILVLLLSIWNQLSFAQLLSDFTPPSGADSAAVDLESPAYFRMMTATSLDGINWTATGNLVTDQGNVPDMINRNDTLYLYYTGWKVGNITNTTVVAISIDNGENWAFKHIDLKGYGTGSLIQNGDPDVIIKSDNTIRMFITTTHNGKKSVLCFDSKNGIDFNYIGLAAHSATDHIFDSNTFLYNGNWHMYAINGINTTHWHLTSTDGLNFTVAGTYNFSEGNNQHFASNGFVDGNEYKMFSSFLPNQDLYSFSTTNGNNWTFNGTELEFGTVSGELSYLKDPAVVKLSNGKYFMVYVTRIACETFSNQSVNSCKNFNWNGKTYTASGTYYDTIPNHNGCDSLMRLQLSIQNINPAVNINNNLLTAIETGANYQWIDCNNNNSLIQNETNQTYTAISNGNYAVIITKGGCADTSSCFNITTTSLISVNVEKEKIIISPNPFSEYTYLSTITSFKQLKISLYNSIGQKVKDYTGLSDNKIIIDRENLPAGVYYIHGIADNVIIDVAKMIIKD